MQLRKAQKKIYVNLFLEPIQEVKKKEPTELVPEKISYIDKSYTKVKLNEDSAAMGKLQGVNVSSPQVFPPDAKPDDTFFKESSTLPPLAPSPTKTVGFAADFADSTS